MRMRMLTLALIVLGAPALRAQTPMAHDTSHHAKPMMMDHGRMMGDTGMMAHHKMMCDSMMAHGGMMNDSAAMAHHKMMADSGWGCEHPMTGHAQMMHDSTMHAPMPANRRRRSARPAGH